MARIAVGGFQHETNTFAPSKADLEDFEAGGAWPPLLSGGDLLEGVRGINLPIAGFIEAALERGHRIIPTTWAAASPSGHVTDRAFETILGRILEGIRAAMPVDAVYLCLHGAMVTESHEDGEGEILRRVRALVGAAVPVVASLDLHANVSPDMVAHADGLVAYRTYPHIDMAETGARALPLLEARLAAGAPLARHLRQLPFLIPLSWQCTDTEPAKGIYEHLASLEGPGVGPLSFTPGFPAADIRHCGPAVFGHGTSPGAVHDAVERLGALVEEREEAFQGRLWSADEGVREAMRIAQRASRPVVLADTQDNPGAGGNSDTTGMLRALVTHGAEQAALGMMVDPEAALAAHAAGVGAHLHLALGGRSGVPGDAPFEAEFRVEALGEGRFQGTGPMYGGTRMDLGPMACLRIGGVRVAVGSRKAQLADQAMYRHVGIEPTRERILVNKSSIHFRADFAPIAEAILICVAPGPMVADTEALPWSRLRPGVRLSPGGTVFRPGG